MRMVLGPHTARPGQFKVKPANCHSDEACAVAWLAIGRHAHHSPVGMLFIVLQTTFWIRVDWRANISQRLGFVRLAACRLAGR